MDEQGTWASLANFFSSALFWQFFFSFILGCLLGAAELMGRYRDEPITLISCTAARYYVYINGVLSCVALVLIIALGLSFAPESAPESALSGAIYNVIAAGFGGAAFFRSSVITTKGGGADVAIGPAFVIDTLLKVTDREVDRYRAGIRSEKITKLIKGVKLADMWTTVVPFSLSLMQNATADEREDINKEVETLRQKTLSLETPTPAEVLGLSLKLAEITSFDVLESTIETLSNQGFLTKRAEPTEGDSEAASATRRPDFGSFMASAKAARVGAGATAPATGGAS